MNKNEYSPFIGMTHMKDPRVGTDYPVSEMEIVRDHLERKKPTVGQVRKFSVDDTPRVNTPSNLNGTMVEITNVDEWGNVTCKFDLSDPIVKEVHGRLGVETYTARIDSLFNDPEIEKAESEQLASEVPIDSEDSSYRDPYSDV